MIDVEKKKESLNSRIFSLNGQAKVAQLEADKHKKLKLTGLANHFQRVADDFTKQVEKLQEELSKLGT